MISRHNSPSTRRLRRSERLKAIQERSAARAHLKTVTSPPEPAPSLPTALLDPDDTSPLTLPTDLGSDLSTASSQALMHPALDPTLVHPHSTLPPVVDLVRVTKEFSNGNCVLNDVSLRIRQGDFIFITGVSGAGKSTLLRLLYGAEQPTQGTVMVNQVCLNRIRPRPLAMLRRQLGVVFQDYQLLANRTVQENIAFVLRAQGISPMEIQRRMDPTLKMVGLVDKAACFPNELSGGEQQRLSLARAIANRPILLIADEPTGNLDRENSLLVLQVLQRLNAFGVTIVMSSHDPYLIDRTQHRVVRIEDSQLIDVR